MQAALYFNRKRRRCRVERSNRFTCGEVYADPAPPPEPEDEKLVLVELTQTDGDKVSIVKDERAVSSIEQKGSRTIVHMANGDSHTVVETYADVKAALEE